MDKTASIEEAIFTVDHVSIDIEARGLRDGSKNEVADVESAAKPAAGRPKVPF